MPRSGSAWGQRQNHAMYESPQGWEANPGTGGRLHFRGLPRPPGPNGKPDVLLKSQSCRKLSSNSQQVDFLSSLLSKQIQFLHIQKQSVSNIANEANVI